jgi:hypothetical protein
MTRSSTSPALKLILALALLSYMGCDSADKGDDLADGTMDGPDTIDGGSIGYSAELQALTPPSTTSHAETGASLAVDGNWMVVSVPGTIHAGEQRRNGSVEVYQRDELGWRAFATLKADDSVADDQREFGAAVDIFGSTIVVGDPSWAGGNNHKAGAVYVFEWSGEAWLQEARLNADTLMGFDVFGKSVAVSEDSIVVGSSGRALGEDTAAGAVFLFERSVSGWNLETTVQRRDNEEIRFLGLDVDIEGSRAVVGSSGAAHTLSAVDGPWGRSSDITPLVEPDVGFGGTVAVDGDVVVVGSAQDDSSASTSGAAYVFRVINGEWVEEAKLKSPSPSYLGFFGHSVAVAGDWVLVGEPNQDGGSPEDVNDSAAEDSGAAYLYKYDGSSWQLDRYIKSPNIVPSARFGWAVSLTATTLSVSAPGESAGDEVNVGAVYTTP